MKPNYQNSFNNNMNNNQNPNANYSCTSSLVLNLNANPYKSNKPQKKIPQIQQQIPPQNPIFSNQSNRTKEVYIDNFIQALEEKEIYNKLGEADILEGLQDIGIGFQGAVGTIKEYLSRVPKPLKVVGAHNGGGRGLPWRIVQGYNKETMPDLVRKYGIPVRITSGYRGYNTASGDNSWHRAKDNFGNPAAYDIVPLDRNYNNLLKWIFSRPAVVKEFLDRGWGILDESTRENIKQKRTGATGFHFHIGPDSLSKKEFLGAMKAYNPTMFYQYIKDGSVSNSYMDAIEECSRKILSQVYAYAASQRNNSKKVNKSVTNKKVKA